MFYIKPQPYLRDYKISSSCFFWMFYIKPQLDDRTGYSDQCCFFWMFYIKPQLGQFDLEAVNVVSFGCSTSNHNRSGS